MLLLARNRALAVICLLVSAALYGADQPITVGLVYDGATSEDREPLRAYLTKAMGRPVILEAADLQSDNIDRIANGSYDFACLGALAYIQSRARSGVIPLVQRTSDLYLHSVFITGATSSIHSLSDLKGRLFAFGDIKGASTHLIPYRELMRAGIDPQTDLKVRFSGSNPATAALVQTGVVDAGALDETIFNSLISDGKLDSQKVRVFYTSKPFVAYVFVARKDVPVAERERFARALLVLKAGKDDSVLRILRAKRFVVANDEEYAPIRQIAHQLNLF
jgi:phosphonate transport system substrate-binding protein